MARSKTVSELASVGYLGISINGAIYTINAYVPARRNRVLFIPSFLASWITIELAWFHLLWQVIVTLIAGRLGAFKHRAGKLGLVVSAASWAGLALTIKHSLDARHEIRAALNDLEHERRASRRYPVKISRNIVYHQVGNKKLRLDVHEPSVRAEPGTKRPVLVQIHGGGWTIGDKREQGRLILRRMASDGWVCFNVNYRLSPRATFPDHIVDVKRAIAWIREHADDYGIDPGFIAVTGGSAGGHLASLAALTAGDPWYQPGFEDADTSVQAAVPYYGVYDFTNRHGHWPDEAITRFIEPVVMKATREADPEKFAKASPLDQVHPGAPPFFVIHGDRDTLAPIEDARIFVERLRAVSEEPVYFLELHGAQHAFELFPSIRANQVTEAAAHFLDAVHNAYLREGGHLSPSAVREAVAEELGGPEVERALSTS
ncbi:MAG: alpha/beta hydrolase [Acidimicrobiales bacterium]|nr:alpha/beta hydrolase [Acidimicrobiales bacterium]